MIDFGLGLFAASGWLFAIWVVWHFTNRAELPQSETECPHGRSKLKFCKDCSKADPLLQEPAQSCLRIISGIEHPSKDFELHGATDLCSCSSVVHVDDQGRLLMACPECQKEYTVSMQNFDLGRIDWPHSAQHLCTLGLATREVSIEELRKLYPDQVRR